MLARPERRTSTSRRFTAPRVPSDVSLSDRIQRSKPDTV